jgi:hypothetical protein
VEILDGSTEGKAVIVNKNLQLAQDAPLSVVKIIFKNT